MRAKRLWVLVLVCVCASIPGPVAAQDTFGPQTFGSPADALLLSGQSLVDMDLLSGTQLFDVGGGVAGTSELFAASALAGAGPMDSVLADATAELQLRQAEAQRIAAERLATQPREALANQCPTSTPANTLRDGAAEIGIFELCARSVRQAPSETAAKALLFAFDNLGVPYSQPLRMTDGHFDCSSFVSRAYDAAGVEAALATGWAPTTRQLAPYPGYQGVSWLETITWDEKLPGDLMLTSPSRADGGGHVVMVAADGFMLHTASTGDVSHVKAIYQETRVPYVRRVVE